MSIDEILKTDDVNDFIPALSDHVEQKCGYDGNMDALSDPERIFLIALTCEIEVNNGGFAQYFYNSSGNFAGELENAFREVGAVKLGNMPHGARCIRSGAFLRCGRTQRTACQIEK